jgi:gas vesicle protein
MDDRTAYLRGMLFFLAGGVAGAGVALLLAPQSGRSTREMMGRKLRESADSATELKDRLVRRGQDIRAEASHRVEEATSILAGRRSAADKEDLASVVEANGGQG